IAGQRQGDGLVRRRDNRPAASHQQLATLDRVVVLDELPRFVVARSANKQGLIVRADTNGPALIRQSAVSEGLCDRQRPGKYEREPKNRDAQHESLQNESAGRGLTWARRR